MAFREEAFSFFTHLAGALAALVGLVLLVQRAESTLAIAALGIYGATLVLMFATSTLHHVSHREDGLFRRLDMTAIYLFIAGTYTPICLLALPRALGVPVVALAWLLALVGIGLRWTVPRTPRWVTAGLYLGLGWMSLLGGKSVYVNLSPAALWLLVGGGVVYSVGAVVYATRRPDPWPRFVGYHGLWHVFVLAGAGLHFALIWRYVPVA